MTPERAPPLHASKQDDHDGPLSPFEEGIAVWCWWTVCVCVPERDVIVHHGESTVDTEVVTTTATTAGLMIAVPIDQLLSPGEAVHREYYIYLGIL
jgi:hypothetical protein